MDLELPECPGWRASLILSKELEPWIEEEAGRKDDLGIICLQIFRPGSSTPDRLVWSPGHEECGWRPLVKRPPPGPLRLGSALVHLMDLMIGNRTNIVSILYWVPKVVAGLGPLEDVEIALEVMES